jgi:hypothetical protein
MMSARYRRENADKIRAYHAKYRLDHKDEISARLKKYYERRHARAPKVGAEVLKAAREDPLYEAHHGIRDFVICRICGAKPKQIAYAHLRRDDEDLTTKGYLLQFPGAPMWCAASRQKQSSVGRRVKSKLRHRTRRNMKSVYAHPGEKSMRFWPCVDLLAAGKTVAETSKALKRKEGRIRRVAKIVGLSTGRRDLGTVVTRRYAGRLYKASGLDQKSFARVFGISLQLAYEIAILSRGSRRLSRSQADSIINIRDSFICELARQKRSWTWGRNNLSGVLMSLFPDLRRKYRLLLEIFDRTATFLQAESDAGIDSWQDWLCDQARFEVAGSPPGNLFTRFLPFAREISPFVNDRLGTFRAGYRVSRLAIEALAWRLKTSSVIVGYCLKSGYEPRPVRPHAMQRLILGTMFVQPPAQTAPARSRGGRSPGRPATKRERFVRAEIMFEKRGLKYTEIARQLIPEEYEKDPRAAAEAIRQGVIYLKRKREEVPARREDREASQK